MNRNIMKFVAIFILYFANVSCMQESEYQEALKKQAPAIRKLIMDILQLVDQSAYSAIAKNDPTGIKHIRFDNTEFFSTDLNPIDGLPVFIMDPYFFTILPLKQKMFAIAHELAHYMMDDFEELYKKSYQTEKDFNLLTNALRRVQENEADRLAILHFRINIDDAIGFMKSILAMDKEDEIKHPEKKTFTRTHPLSIARIQHLESLRREVEIQRTPPKPINWTGLAQKYLAKYFGR